MLGPSEVDRISKGFGVYDHEWRFYSRFLGHPNLANDLITYFDSDVLYVCAFSLDDPFREVSASELAQIIGPFESRAAGVNIWGRFNCPDSISLNSQTTPPSHFSGYDDTCTSLVVPVDGFDYSEHPKARKSIRTAYRNGTRGVLRETRQLTDRHRHLVAEWAKNINPSRVHQTMAQAALEYAEEEGTWVIDVLCDSRLVGFAILSFPSRDRSVMLNSFRSYSQSDRRLRVGDVISATSLSLLRDRGIKRLYRGYSTTTSLEDFKRKWGASLAGPPYSEAFFSNSKELRESFANGTILKRDRG